MTFDSPLPVMDDLDAVLRALSFAAEHHVDQTSEGQQVHVRKGTTTPYLSHLMIVAGFVWESGGDTQQVIAAVLHDTIEDTAVTHDVLVTEFGRDVADLVAACSDQSDTGVRDASTWRVRKESYVQTLSTKSPRAKLITAADKAHNGSAIVADIRTFGPTVWSRFNASPAEIAWYYTSVADGVRDDLAHLPVMARLDDAVASLSALAMEAQ